VAPGLTVIPIRHGPFWNFSYLIACNQTNEAAVIDPAWDVPGILRSASDRGFVVAAALLTHGHSDHTNGLDELVLATGAKVIGHDAELPGIRERFAGQVTTISGDDVLLVGRVPVRLLHTPGHTPGSLSILADGRLFTGDTLNIGSPGRPGPESDSVEALWQSIGRLVTESDGATVIHPGHDDGPVPQATMAEELERNPTLRAGSFLDFVRELERATGRNHGHKP